MREKRAIHNRAEQRNRTLMSMELHDDLVVEIISHLPLKLAVQCKILSKGFYNKISDPKFFQTLLQHQNISTLLIYSGYLPEIVHKISINPTQTTHCETILHVSVSVLGSSKGLLLLDFYDLMTFCVFNPITGAHQLIPHPERTKYKYGIGEAGLATGYPTSDQYKLVTVGKLAELEEYKFYVFSSEGSGVWHKVQSNMNLGNNFSYLARNGKPIYVHDSLHWLRYDGSVFAFGTKRKKATILDFPEFINHHDFISGKIRPGCNTWLGMSQGLLTLVCALEKSIVIATYDYVSDDWRVSHTLDNLVTRLEGYNYGFPVWIDSKHVAFLLDHGYLYEYNSEINRYEIVAVSDKDYMVHDGLYWSYEPTLANVQKTPNTVRSEHMSDITAALDELKQFITS